MKTIFLSLILALVVNGQSQYSIHKLHRELYGKNVVIKKTYDESIAVVPLNTNTKKSLDVMVFGYLPDWEYANNSHQYFRYDLLTHIACFDFNVSSDGTIGNPAGWPWNDLINDAHTNGVKVILCAVNFDGDEIRNIITNETAKQKFFQQAKAKIETYNLDGINVDFESLLVDDRADKINNFMAELTNYIHTELPGKEVSFAAPVWDWSDRWDQVGLASSVDYIFIMGYSFYGKWSDNSGPGSPLWGSNSTSPSVGASFITEANYLHVVQTTPGKLILGIPYYGLWWKTNSSSARSTVINFVKSPRFREAEPLSKIYDYQWDNTSQTPWLRWNDGDWNQVWYDNDESLELKYDLVTKNNLGGIGMWALGYDGERQELWNLIDLKFGSHSIPPPLTPVSFNITNHSDNSLIIDFEFPQQANGFEVFISTDAADFFKLIDQYTNTFSVPNLYPKSVFYFKISSFNETGKSVNSELLAAVPSYENHRILIVHGFDRISGTVNNFDYIKMYGTPLLENGYAFSSASNEAVFRDRIDLNDYEVVIWILGDESTSDETFNLYEQEKVKGFLINGGKLFVTGAEIGWDLFDQGGGVDQEFYHKYLKADYISDAPNNSKSTYYSAIPEPGSILDGINEFSFDNGTHGTFDVDWPDAIRARDGAVNILQFKNVSTSAGYAGIAYSGLFPEGMKEGKLVYLSIPFETIYPEETRINLMSKVMDFFGTATSLHEHTELAANEFKLFQNYPNPFNPITTITFSLPEAASVSLHIYNSLGEIIRELISHQTFNSGSHSIQFDGVDLASGIYVYRLETNGVVQSKKMILLK